MDPHDLHGDSAGIGANSRIQRCPPFHLPPEPPVETKVTIIATHREQPSFATKRVANFRFCSDFFQWSTRPGGKTRPLAS
jgi:hypothetical protein